jgi:hypothetical protein
MTDGAGSMNNDLARIGCASLPASQLGALAELRREREVTVTLAGDRAWVRWTPANRPVLERVLPLPGAELYDNRGGLWYRIGDRLPSFGLPIDQGQVESMPLDRAITPLRVEPMGATESAPVPMRLRLVRHGRARPATALRCTLDALGAWSEMAPSALLAGLGVARAGERVMLIGQALPPIIAGERFWGVRVLAPLGFRPDPELPERALRGALGADDNELLLVSSDGVEVIPLDAFEPLTRSGVRLALGVRPGGRPA